MNMSNTITQFSFLFHLIPFKIYNLLTNDSFVTLRINEDKHYLINYNASTNMHLISFNKNNTESNRQYILSY
jgi:hypothetical protein